VLTTTISSGSAYGERLSSALDVRGPSRHRPSQNDGSGFTAAWKHHSSGIWSDRQGSLAFSSSDDSARARRGCVPCGVERLDGSTAPSLPSGRSSFLRPGRRANLGQDSVVVDIFDVSGRARAVGANVVLPAVRKLITRRAILFSLSEMSCNAPSWRSTCSSRRHLDRRRLDRVATYRKRPILSPQQIGGRCRSRKLARVNVSSCDELSKNLIEWEEHSPACPQLCASRSSPTFDLSVEDPISAAVTIQGPRVGT